MPKGILLDIEGTTTPISFVYDVLFPFARQHVAEYLAGGDVTDLELEHKEDIRNGQQSTAVVCWSAGLRFLVDGSGQEIHCLKENQGEIWLKGYEAGELHGEVYPDVPKALKRWVESGIDVRIFSSGSVLAQRLLFSRTRDGDLTRFLRGYFDTTTGAKTEPESYKRIAEAFGLLIRDILFISDVTRELDAAAKAGMQTALCIRPGNHAQPEHSHRIIATFADIS